MEQVFSVFFLLFLLCCSISAISTPDGDLEEAAANISPDDEVADEKQRALSVLMLSLPDPGHLIPVATLGKSLSRRGHNVTLCTSDRDGSDLPQKLCENVAMNFFSVGPDHLSLYDYNEENKYVHDKMLLSVVSTVSIRRCSEVTKQLAQLDAPWIMQWHIIITDVFLAPGVSCLHKKWGVPMISLGSSLLFPPWPFEALPSKHGHDPVYSQRVVSALMNFMYKLLTLKWIHGEMSSMGVTCNTTSISYASYIASGTTAPLIISTAFGLEHPHPTLPLVHYVGPMIPDSDDPLPSDLDEWLADKPRESVIYVSMGSSAHLSPSIRKAIAGGILSTNYSVVWSLRDHDGADSLLQPRDRFFVSSWLPQQCLLQSDRIVLAILHAGMGGVAESLYHGIPLIVIPFIWDQSDIASRVEQQGVGVRIYRSEVTVDNVKRAIETLENVSYRRAAKRLSKVFRHAGGVEAAADLVEFYQDVGYDHMIPAYAKYGWNWVEYYNIDVYITMLLSSIVLPLGIIMLYKKCIWPW